MNPITVWFGDYFNGTYYSWADYASKQGYSVLAIDRLGNGQSDHPDPILDVQYPAQVEQIHQIILEARAGTLPGITKKFTTILYAGHSYGSITGNALNRIYPNDVNATILTGFSYILTTVIPAVFAQARPLPADLLQPQRFGNLSPFYLEFSSIPSIQELFFYPGGYSYDLFEYDTSKRGTISLGEAATVALTSNIAADYTNPVYVVTGEKDAVFCNFSGLNLSPLLPVSCTAGGYLTGTKAFYPNVEVFDTYAVPNSGHCWQLHYAAPEAFALIHSWLTYQGF